MEQELEKEYTATVEQIKQKMQECAAALAEAAKLAKSINEDITTMYLEDENGKYVGSAIEALFHKMNELGWSTSSLSC